MTKEKDPDLEKLLDLEQVGQVLGTCTRTVRRIINKKELPAIRIGKLLRVHPRDLARYIAVNRTF